MSLAPYVSSPMRVVEKMLEAAKLKVGEVLYDLGSGDGRIVIMAAEQYGVTAVGVELDKGRAKGSTKKIKEMALEDKVQVIHGNFMDVDISPADVVTLYLLESANDTLKPKLERSLKSGTRIISHDFEVPGWKPEKVLSVDTDYWNFDSMIYVYRKR